MRRLFVLASLAALACPAPRPGVAAEPELDLEGTVFAAAGREARLDPLLLYAIAMVESGRPLPGGRAAPHPWTLGAAGGPVYAQSRAQAARELARLLASEPNVDVGLMQVSTRYHGRLAGRPEALLDPLTNVRAGAAILNRRLAETPGDALAAIGRYHSADPERSYRYAAKVWRLYVHLKHKESQYGTQ
ncbi:MAG: lytic transglycosylase domain-containing protein [Duodenibacillus sp.]|nr:lytic transglycosylase domain-containing protein [Duodenibacillus sp.]